MKKEKQPTPKDDEDTPIIDSPAPLPMKSIEDFKKKYNKVEIILDSDE